MSRQLATAILSIPNGAKPSSSLGDFWGANPAKVALDHASYINIQAPSTLTGTVTVQVAQVSPAAAADFANLSSGGSDVTIAAGKNVLIPVGVAARDLRLNSGSDEGAKRDFLVTLQEDIG